MRQTRKAPVRPVYYARPWQPDDGVWPVGLILALLVCLLAGGVIGLALGLMADTAYVIVAFPLVAGILLGAAGVLAVRLGHIRNAAIAVTLAIIAAVGCVSTMHVTVHARRVAAAPDATPADIVQFLIAEARDPGIGALRRLNPMLPLHELGTWAARLADLLIIGLVAAVLMRLQAIEPYDPQVGMWKQRREIGKVHGTGQQVAGAFLSGRLDRVAALQKDRGQPVRVFAWGAAIHETQSTVEIELLQPEAGSGGRVEWARLIRISYPYRALADIGAALQRRLPPMTRKAVKKRPPFPKPKQVRKGITHRHVIKPALVPRANTTHLLYREATRVHRITSGRVQTVSSRRSETGEVSQAVPTPTPAGAPRDALQTAPDFDALSTAANIARAHVVPPPPKPANRPPPATPAQPSASPAGEQPPQDDSAEDRTRIRRAPDPPAPPAPPTEPSA